MEDMLPALDGIRNRARGRYEIGRNLSLAFTHLEDAITRADNAQQGLLHDLMGEEDGRDAKENPQ